MIAATTSGRFAEVERNTRHRWIPWRRRVSCFILRDPVIENKYVWIKPIGLLPCVEAKIMTPFERQELFRSSLLNKKEAVGRKA